MKRTEVVCQMAGVREALEGFPVSLVRNPTSGRLMVQGMNEGGNGIVWIDLMDLLDWTRNGLVLEAGHGLDT